MNLNAIRTHSAKFFYLLVLLAGSGISARAQNVFKTPEGFWMEVHVGLRRGEVLPGEPALVAVDCTFSKAGETIPKNGFFPYTPTVVAELVSLTVLDANGNDARQEEPPREILNTNVSYIGSTLVRQIDPRNIRTIYLLNDWVTLRKPGTYHVRIQIHLRFVTGDLVNNPTLTITEESFLTVLPNDDALFASLIEDIGHGSRRDTHGLNLERLIRFDDPRIIPFLLRELDRLDSKVRREPPIPPLAQREKQEPMNGPIFIGAGMGLIDCTPSEISRICQILIRFPQKNAIDAVANMARSPSAPVRGSLASALQLSRRPAALSILATMWDDPSYEVRASVAKGLAFDSTPETLSILQNLMEDEDETVRDAARKSLDARKANNPK